MPLKMWEANDPEPPTNIQVVQSRSYPYWRGQWHRIRPKGWDNEYRWSNGDKVRTWRMIVRNWGPLVDSKQIRHMHQLYHLRHRR